MLSERLVPAAAAVWISCIFAGLIVVWNYENAPAESGAPAGLWPANAGIVLDDKLPTLVMAAHPQCVCTRASIAELARLEARFGGKLQAHILFYRPARFGESWVHSGLWDSAAAIPGVTPQEDVDGALAERFGARASGHVFLYSPNGHLLFSGGITAARGHEGDNAGIETIASLVKTGRADRKSTFVFGCSLSSRRT